MQLDLKAMMFTDLLTEAQSFLLALNESVPSEEEEGIALYLRKGEEFYFINDFALKNKANLAFEKGASEHNLYRGGALVMIIAEIDGEKAMIVIPDQRYDWSRAFGGHVQFSEGMHLDVAGKRELGEEVFLFTLVKENRKRLVPKGLKDISNDNYLRLEITEMFESGEVKLDYFVVNEKNRALEAVMSWDLGSLDIEANYSCIHNEDWWEGGDAGIIVYAIALKDKRILGFFSGLQGFIPLPKYGFHPTLIGYFENIKNSPKLGQ